MGNKLRGNTIDGRDGWSWLRSWRPSAEQWGPATLQHGNGQPWKTLLRARANPEQHAGAQRQGGTGSLRRSGRPDPESESDKISLFCRWDLTEKKAEEQKKRHANFQLLLLLSPSPQPDAIPPCLTHRYCHQLRIGPLPAAPCRQTTQALIRPRRSRPGSLSRTCHPISPRLIS